MLIKCASLYGNMRRIRHIEVPRQDPRSVGGIVVGRVQKDMCGTHDSPQIWSAAVKQEMTSIVLCASTLHPLVCWDPKRGLTVAVHADDFLRGGTAELV